MEDTFKFCGLLTISEFHMEGLQIVRQPYCFLTVQYNTFSNLVRNQSLVFDRSTCSKRSKESLFSKKNKLPRAIYSILVNFTMFSFPVLTCSRIVSIHIIFMILNKFRHVWTCSDMFENHKNCINLYHIEPEQVQTYFNMFKCIWESHEL